MSKYCRMILLTQISLSLYILYNCLYSSAMDGDIYTEIYKCFVVASSGTGTKYCAAVRCCWWWWLGGVLFLAWMHNSGARWTMSGADARMSAHNLASTGDANPGASFIPSTRQGWGQAREMTRRVRILRNNQTIRLPPLQATSVQT